MLFSIAMAISPTLINIGEGRAARPAATKALYRLAETYLCVSSGE
jgi:hypothetical protein